MSTYASPRPGARGHLGLWAGMVLANRPWKMLPAFKGAIAASLCHRGLRAGDPFDLAAGHSMGWARLLLLMVVAMVAWIIVAHHLWERPEDPDQQKRAVLYNGVTMPTMSVALLSAYAILFALIFLAAWVFVPGAYFETTLKHPVGFGEYVTLAWLRTSLATVAGALGASLEDEEMVRKASYGYRQRRRHEDNDAEDMF